MASTAYRAGPAPDSGGLVVPDKPIDASLPYRPREKGASRHFGFFPFFAKKPWQVVQAYIKHYAPLGGLVCDPFAGSGVTPVEALVLGRRAVASDINPVARFITRMTAVAPVDLVELHAAYEQVRVAAQAPIEALNHMPEERIVDLLRDLDYPRDPIPSTVRRAGATTVDELHTPRQLAGLTLLRDAIDRVEDALQRDLLRVAFANTVRYANRTYAGRGAEESGSQYRGNANFLRRFSFSLASRKLFHEHQVWPTFQLRFDAVREAKEETNRLIGQRYNPANFTLAEVPASHIHEVTGEGAVDYCFTDPPYANEIHFLDLSVLWAAWLRLPITDEARRAELLFDKTRRQPRQQAELFPIQDYRKTRQWFEQEFAASMDSIGRALKEDRWFTLVYKHRDLSLVQTIVAACEASGLRYVNVVWQQVGIPSTQQIESPDVNPKGDMYLNFRKMPQQRFEAIYRRHARVIELPTRANYIEHEVERLIVTHLGADIELITSQLIQKVLESRAFLDYKENPQRVDKDLRRVLNGPRFSTWQPAEGTAQWVMAPGAPIDASLPLVDRARYAIFDLLRKRDEATEGEVAEYLLTRFAEEPASERLPVDVPALLRSVGQLVAPHRWRFDAERVSDYKQLRLIFTPGRVDALREQVEERHQRQDERSLLPDLEGLALLRDRLREANRANPDFDEQYGSLLAVLQTVLLRLQVDFGDQIERVLAVGDWAQEGIDLRNLPYDDVLLDIVLNSAERPFPLYVEIAEKVFNDLHDEDILVQFQLETLPEWQHAVSVARATGREGGLGIPLLTRT